MPGSGYNATNTKLVREMLEACRFAYKAYAQSCTYPLDPFFESHGESDSARDRLMTKLHADYNTRNDEGKFDPVDYDLKKAPNPCESVVYRGGVKNEPYILFQPRPFDCGIAQYTGFDIEGNRVPYGGGAIGGAQGARRCAFFQGKTGMTKTWKLSGWPSWLGAVVFDPATGRLIVVFRGSRSGNGARALVGAKLGSKGSPDWVTDMNYLKGETIAKFNDAEISCGFFYAYESCKASLLAAMREVLQGGGDLTSVCVTGHSLGGALAQLAYLDFCGGDFVHPLVMRQERWTPIQCFAISAPPIVLGIASHRKIAMDMDATQIFHYFCPGDAVHNSPLLNRDLIPKLMRVGNWVLENFSHPLTDPVHLGSEIPLKSDSSFPEAHEPRDVYKGLYGGTLDGGFWPTFTLNHTASSGPYITGDGFSPGFPHDALRDALRHSITPDRALARAMLWRDVIKNEGRSVRLTEHIATWQRAINLVSELDTRNFSPYARQQVQHTIRTLRAELLTGALDTNHTASSSCYWTLLQGLSVAEHLLS